MLIINILCQFSFKYKISKKQLLKCFSIINIQNQMALLKDFLILFHDIFDIFTAYERYKSLI